MVQTTDSSDKHVTDRWRFDLFKKYVDLIENTRCMAKGRDWVNADFDRMLEVFPKCQPATLAEGILKDWSKDSIHNFVGLWRTHKDEDFMETWKSFLTRVNTVQNKRRAVSDPCKQQQHDIISQVKSDLKKVSFSVPDDYETSKKLDSIITLLKGIDKKLDNLTTPQRYSSFRLD